MDEPTLTREQAWGWGETMVIAAVRHCLANHTGIVLDGTDWIVESWTLFSERNRAQIRKDVEAHFQNNGYPADDWATRHWEKVRALWTQPGKSGE